MRKLLITLGMLCTLMSNTLYSCRELEINDAATSNLSSSRLKYSDEEIFLVKKEFSLSLAKSLASSPMLRKIIKEKALELIDEDYDVLYQTIKTEELENEIKVKELIKHNFTNSKNFNKIDRLLPTLTIFVPSLPMNSFSAESWNVNKQIPIVGIQSRKTNDVTTVDSEGKESTIEAKYYPSFPIVVVKENIRIVASTASDNKRTTSSSTFTNADGDITFSFIDDAFDHKSNERKKKSARLAYTETIDQKVVDARNIFLGTDNWDRDYIYYNLTPTQNKGSFSYDFSETITSFRIDDRDPMGTFNRLADQTDDPKWNPVVSVPPNTNPQQTSFWTSGSFTFAVKLIVNGTNGAGSEIIKYFPARPSELFHCDYQMVGGLFYQVTNVTPTFIYLNIPVFKWDLAQYSLAVKLTVEEVDEQTVTQYTDTQTSKFTTNFAVDSGLIKKVGLKGGATFETEKSTSVVRTVTQGNDPMGEAVVNFGDKVITDSYYTSSGGQTYIVNEVSGGSYWITIEPKKVQ